MFVVLDGATPVEVWPSIHEARRSALAAGLRYEPRFMLLDGNDPLQALIPVSGCRGCGGA